MRTQLAPLLARWLGFLVGLMVCAILAIPLAVSAYVRSTRLSRADHHDDEEALASSEGVTMKCQHLEAAFVSRARRVTDARNRSVFRLPPSGKVEMRRPEGMRNGGVAVTITRPGDSGPVQSHAWIRLDPELWGDQEYMAAAFLLNVPEPELREAVARL